MSEMGSHTLLERVKGFSQQLMSGSTINPLSFETFMMTLQDEEEELEGNYEFLYYIDPYEFMQLNLYGTGHEDDDNISVANSVGSERGLAARKKKAAIEMEMHRLTLCHHLQKKFNGL
jgi:hypothetical protein